MSRLQTMLLLLLLAFCSAKEAVKPSLPMLERMRPLYDKLSAARASSGPPAQPLIVGGTESIPYSHAFIVALYYPGFDVGQGCAGSLVSPSVVLTAAHCVTDSVADMFVSVHRHNVSASPAKENMPGVPSAAGCAAHIPVSSYEIFPGFDYANLDGDVALLYLSSSAPCAGVGTPSIELDTGSNNWAGSELMIAGWGSTGEWFGSPVMLEAEVIGVSNAECNEDYSSINEVTEGMICAENSDPVRGTCSGDSGGPLWSVSTTVTGEQVLKLVGVVSWGAGCDGVYPGVYARVAHYADWILPRLNWSPPPMPTNPEAIEFLVEVGGVDAGWPEEVSWYLTCDGKYIGEGGAPFSATLSATPGECTLEMFDSFGDGWTNFEMTQSHIWSIRRDPIPHMGGAGWYKYTLEDGSYGIETFTLFAKQASKKNDDSDSESASEADDTEEGEDNGK